MIDTDCVSKNRPETPDHLSCECNFRKKIKDLFALPEGFPDQVYVYLRFSARGDTMEQYHFMLFKSFFDISQCLFLLPA